MTQSFLISPFLRKQIHEGQRACFGGDNIYHIFPDDKACNQAGNGHYPLSLCKYNLVTIIDTKAVILWKKLTAACQLISYHLAGL